MLSNDLEIADCSDWRQILNSIIIIGTDPPCPRCQLLRNVVTKKIDELGLKATIQHFSYTTEEAKAIAKRHGLISGTAKDVAKLLNEHINTQDLSNVIETFIPNKTSDFFPYNNCKWSIELDNLLRKYENKAKDLGIMMTPVLIINDVIKHQGSVPEMSKINKWLLELKC